MKLMFAALLATVLAAPVTAQAQDQAKDAAATQVADAFFNAWNIHDVHAMTALWTDDATLINPAGRTAHGSAEIGKLLADEQGSIFKSSTARVQSMRVTRWLGSNTAFCDGDITVDNAVRPDGSPLPQMRIHLINIVTKKDNRWLIAEARPYAFVTMAADSTNAR